jgi:hypothetical protein
VLTNSPVVRSTGARTLFFVSAAVTVAILLWMHQLRMSGALHGLAPIFFVLFAFEDYGATVVALLILLAAVLIPIQPGARQLFRWAGEHPAAVALLSLFFLCVGALAVYHNHPLSMDEYAAYFQSRTFAAGRLEGQFPPALMDWLVPLGFQNFFLSVSHATGHVASAYWPGHALIMTPFTLLGVPWACNPVLSALTLLVVHRLALHLFADTEAAGLALLLAAASPVLFGMGISYYSMPAHLLANSVYALLLVRPTVARAFTAGIVGSIALCLHNPVPHILFAVPWVIWIATRAGGLRLLATLCVGYLPLCGLLGIGWFELTNHLRAEGSTTALPEDTDPWSRFKAVADVFDLPNSTVFIARAMGLAKVWVWAVPGVLLLACAGAWRWRHNPLARLLAASALMTLIGYVFVPVDQGHGWGYRYFHSAWLALPILGAAALTRAPGVAAGTPIFEDEGTRAFVAVCVLLTLTVGVGYRAWQMNEFISDDLQQVPAYSGAERRVVIVDTRFSFYGADLVQNDPLLRGNLMRFVSHGVEEDKVMMREQFPDLHMVYADRYGSVWSTAPVQIPKKHRVE